MGRPKNIDHAILSRLIKNAKTSDRQIAREIGVSQPTITRRRAKLEKEGFLSYKTIPHFKKLGFELMAFVFLVWKREGHKRLHSARVDGEDDYNRRVQSFFSEHPNIILASSGQGLGMTRLAITLHKSYSDYVKFVNSIDEVWGAYLARRDSFIISFKSDYILKLFDFERIIESLHKENSEE